MQEAEETQTVKRPRGRPRKKLIEEVEEEEETEDIESNLSNSELELDECVARRTRSKVVN